jgi:hypothetical protein
MQRHAQQGYTDWTPIIPSLEPEPYSTSIRHMDSGGAVGSSSTLVGAGGGSHHHSIGEPPPSHPLTGTTWRFACFAVKHSYMHTVTLIMVHPMRAFVHCVKVECILLVSKPQRRSSEAVQTYMAIWGSKCCPTCFLLKAVCSNHMGHSMGSPCAQGCVRTPHGLLCIYLLPPSRAIHYGPTTYSFLAAMSMSEMSIAS